jgi:hypothetical protein
MTHHNLYVSSGRVSRSSQRHLPDTPQREILAPHGNQTQNLSRQAAADLRLRPCGHWGQQNMLLVFRILWQKGCGSNKFWVAWKRIFISSIRIFNLLRNSITEPLIIKLGGSEKWSGCRVKSLVTLVTICLLVVTALCCREERNTPNIVTSLVTIICCSVVPAAKLVSYVAM